MVEWSTPHFSDCMDEFWELRHLSLNNLVMPKTFAHKTYLKEPYTILHFSMHEKIKENNWHSHQTHMTNIRLIKGAFYIRLLYSKGDRLPPAPHSPISFGALNYCTYALVGRLTWLPSHSRFSSLFSICWSDQKCVSLDGGILEMILLREPKLAFSFTETLFFSFSHFFCLHSTLLSFSKCVKICLT